MSDVVPGAIALARTPTPTPEPDDVSPDPRRRGAAELIDRLGLFVAPVLIAALAGALALYHRGLDLENAVIQQRSALSWSGKLWPQTQQHLEIATYSTLLVIVIAIPLGIMLTRPLFRRIAPTILTVANAGQAFPAYGLLVGGLFVFGKGQMTVVLCLALFALLPVLRNTMVGLDGVDRSVIEAGRGMGMTRRLVLTRIELPLAVPVIMAGIRTAMVLNIGMATLAFLIGGGALGITISSGLKLNQDPVLIVGAVMVAIVALTFDWLGAVAERYLRPRGL
ncbi:Choline transport system permease protein OpuBB [Nocardioides dokdonensis FR1436]|uniref:Choline transport system permease protein OpuBB n=1 Tax=Nocardioides dokdonensis FR1436 TaxID=1300347 RepID=A0A1A9GF45_9ACTN|nr:ABC transporter permease [Nocardioides dokdonensis]ANH36969.1 Choline transport system permease protein OpuBB [Nocardioides dokdonensis FR1436]